MYLAVGLARFSGFDRPLKQPSDVKFVSDVSDLILRVRGPSLYGFLEETKRE